MSKKALKYFMKANFDFTAFKKAGLYPKELKHTDYEGQAKIICRRLGLESIYDYGKYEIRCHISYAGGESGMDDGRKISVNEKGKLEIPAFVETFFPNSMHITK